MWVINNNEIKICQCTTINFRDWVSNYSTRRWEKKIPEILLFLLFCTFLFSQSTQKPEWDFWRGWSEVENVNDAMHISRNIYYNLDAIASK